MSDVDAEMSGNESDELELLHFQSLVNKNSRMETEKSVINEAGLRHALEEISLPNSYTWDEKLDVTATQMLEIPDVHDDLHREVQFYNQALSAVKTAISKFAEQKIPHRRPTDYFAEMVKSDAHMAKIKRKLLSEQKRIETVETKKKRQLEQKFSKTVRANKLAEKAKIKRDTLNEISRLKTSKKGMTRENINKALDIKEKKEDDFSKGKRSKKRVMKDEKYGNGGKKNKRNDSESLHKSGRHAGRRGKSNRPGKKRRQQERSV